MRRQHVAILFLVAARHVQASVPDLRFREGTTDATSTVADTATTTVAVASSTSSILSSTPNGDEASTSSVFTTETTATSSLTVASVTSRTSTSAASTASSTASKHELPIQPIITAAVGIGGVLLILSGVVLGFVGSRHEQTQIFLSTALVFALAIEVLIIYVMEPPVSDAVQGAYLIAGVVGGCAFGGLGIIFKDIVEGLSPGLGGFCFAMWLLALGSGGLVSSKTGKTIMITVLSVGSWSLSFNRHTRDYAIIVGNSFAGSTVLILGIDCLSKAGLKEFWIYIWDLNSEEFPPNTSTYPLTRHILAEVACIMVVAILGVISQLKLWKTVKQRRDNRARQMREDEETRENLDFEVGRVLEQRNRIERARWESIYGDKSGPREQVTMIDSVFVSRDGSVKATTAIRDRELDRLPTYSDNPKQSAGRRSYPMVTIQRASSDGRTADDPTKYQAPGRRSRSFRSPASSHPHGPQYSSSDNLLSQSANTVSTARNCSQASFATVLTDEDNDGSRLHLSIAKDNTSAPKARDIADDGDSGYTGLPEEDTASSVMATVAEAPDLDTLSAGLTSRHSQIMLAPSEPSRKPLDIEQDAPRETDPSPEVEGHQLQESQPTQRSNESTEDETDTNDTSMKSLTEQLPKGLSRALSIHRTNEWAKQAAQADPEPLDELPEFTIDGIQVEKKDAAQAARAAENNAGTASFEKQNTARQSLQRQSSIPGPTGPPVFWLDRTRRDLTSLPLVESPVEHLPDVGPPASNLMDQRNQRLGSRPSTTSFMNLPRVSLASIHSQPDSGSGAATPQSKSLSGSDPLDEDDMPLSQRKALVQQRQQQHAALQALEQNHTRRTSPTGRRHTNPPRPQYAHPPIRRLNGHSAGVDAHLPQRNNPTYDAARQAKHWTSWRSSQPAANNNNNSGGGSGPDPMDWMLQRRRHSEQQVQARQRAEREQQAQVDALLRMGVRDGQHRAVLKRMQSEVRERTTGQGRESAGTEAVGVLRK